MLPEPWREDESSTEEHDEDGELAESEIHDDGGDENEDDEYRAESA